MRAMVANKWDDGLPLAVSLSQWQMQKEELLSPGPVALLHRPSLQVRAASGPRESDQLPQCAKARMAERGDDGGNGSGHGGATPAATVRKERMARRGGGQPPHNPPGDLRWSHHGADKKCCVDS